jgi:hypothetical protein
MGRGRVLTGRGRATNSLDNDRVVITVGVRGATVVSIGDDSIRTGMMTTFAGGQTQEVWFKDGAEARALGGETFAGCDVARNAALILYKVFIGRTIDECLAVAESELRVRMAGDLDDDRGCVATMLAAVRRALIDVQVSALAEAVVNARRLQPADV